MKQYLGRLRLIRELTSRGKFSLSIGSKNTQFANINLDVDPSTKADIIAAVQNLPFKSNPFELIFFTDIIEHLPKGEEVRALREINRVLKNDGELILTTPYSSFLFTNLDPAFWIRNHRHYSLDEIKKLLEKSGFNAICIFTSGGLWACLSNLWYCVLIYPLRKIFNINLKIPYFLQQLEDNEYQLCRERNGYTIFLVGTKVRM